MFSPLHPGEIVKDTLLDATGLTVTKAAQKLGISRAALSRLVNRHSGISPEMALRLAKLFNTSIESWINLQAQYDTWKISQDYDKINIEPLEPFINSN